MPPVASRPSPISGSPLADSTDVVDRLINNIDLPFMVPETVLIREDAFDMNELETALSTMRSDRAADNDGIVVEVLRLPVVLPILLGIINRMFSDNPCPSLIESFIFLVYKKGDASLLSNYRGIAILKIVTKVYTRMLGNRLVNALDSHLRPSQNGFRPGRGCPEHILALRRLVEETQCRPEAKLFVAFVDYVKAFDSVNWVGMWAVLRAYRVPDRLIRAIRALYEHSRAFVRTADGDSDWFEFMRGVKQGCCMSPFLFIVLLDFVMRHAIDPILGVQVARRTSSRHPAVHVTDLSFADDVTLMSTSISNLQEQFDQLVCWGRPFGLEPSVSKTELLAVGQHEVSPVLFIDGCTPIVASADFKLLGSWIMNSFKDFTCRRAAAWSAAIALERYWMSPHISRCLKRSLFRAMVETVLLYGSETWTASTRLNDRLNGTYTRLLRFCLGKLHWGDHIKLRELHGRLPRVADLVRQRCARFAGHCWRRRQDGVATQPIADVMLWQPPSGRSVGRPRTTFVDVLCADTGYTKDELPRAMADRDNWSDVVSRLKPQPIPL